MQITRITLIIILLITILGTTVAQDASKDISATYGFDEMEIIKLDWGIMNLLIADFNGDKAKDIAISNNAKACVEILIQKDSMSPQETPISVDPQDIDINQINALTRFDKQSLAVSEKIFSLVQGDLNSDGLTDIAYYGEPMGLYVVLQKTQDNKTDKTKKLNWRTRKKIKIANGLVTPSALACGDINYDGAADLALAGQDATYIILQNKKGTLAEPVKYPTTATTLGIEIGDVNGDGINDLVLITNDAEKPVHVRFGLKTGQLGPQERFFMKKPYALDLYDVDGNIAKELLSIEARSGRLISYQFTNGKENSNAGNDWPVLMYPLASGQGSTKRDLVAADFDDDGLVDITISDPGAAELVFYKQMPQTGLAEPIRFPALSDIDSLSVADIDGDGKNELAVLSIKEKIIGISEFENDRFLFPKPLPIIDQPVALKLADMDGDSNVDYLYISKDANDLRKLRIKYNNPVILPDNANAPAKETKQDFAMEIKKLTANPDGMRVLDVDQDGLNDILIFVQYEQPILIRQTSKRKFQIVDSPNAQASLIKDASLRSIAVADVDESDGGELLIAQKNFARSLIFADGKNWSIIDQYNAKSKENNITAVAAFYLDGTEPGQKPCIILLDGQKQQLQVLKAGEDKTYRFEKEIEVGKWNSAVNLKMIYAPLTGGSSKSILLFDSEKFALITPAKNNLSARDLEQKFSYETKIKDGVYGNLTAGDINDDGKADIVMVDYKGNNIEILAIDDNGLPVSAFRWKIFEQKSFQDDKRGKPSVEPRELKVADVTGDGKNDLITVIHDRIIIYPQD